MREFLKRNALALGVLFCGYAVFSLAQAGTFTRTYGSSDYAGGQKAVGSKINTEFNDLANFLNGGNIGTANLEALGVTTAKVATGAITPAKIASSNLKVTSSSSAYAMSSVVPATITNLSTTYTSNGRPVYIGLEAAPATYLSSLVATYGSSVTTTADPVKAFAGAIYFVTDSSTTAHFPLWNLVSSGIAVGAPAYTGIPYRCADFHYTDSSMTSGVTYTISAKVSAATTSTAVVSVTNCRLVVREEF